MELSFRLLGETAVDVYGGTDPVPAVWAKAVISVSGLPVNSHTESVQFKSESGIQLSKLVLPLSFCSAVRLLLFVPEAAMR